MIISTKLNLSGACARRLRGSKNTPTVPDLGNANVGINRTFVPLCLGMGVFLGHRAVPVAAEGGGV